MILVRTFLESIEWIININFTEETTRICPPRQFFSIDHSFSGRVYPILTGSGFFE